jgi:molybdate transport repressor ModE-like protein
MLSSGRLLLLHVVAQHGTLSAAARELGLSQPAVAQQIRRLEAEAGVALLIRSGRGVRLTEAGRALVNHAAVIADRLALAEREALRFARSAGKQVRLAAFSACQATIVTRAVAHLRDTASPVQLDLVTASPNEALALLGDGKCDIAVIFDVPGMRRPRRRSWLRVRLTRDRVFAVLPAGHRLADQSEVELKDLADERWVVSGHCVIDTCQDADFTPSVGLATDDPYALPNLIAAGFGVGLMSDLLLSTMPEPDVVLLPLAQPPRNIVAIADRTFADRPAIRTTIQALRAAGNTFTGSIEGRTSAATG